MGICAPDTGRYPRCRGEVFARFHVEPEVSAVDELLQNVVVRQCVRVNFLGGGDHSSRQVPVDILPF